MTKIRLQHFFLALALAGFGVAILDQRPAIESYLALPLSTISFILFLIFHMLEWESALLDQQTLQAAPVAAMVDTPVGDAPSASHPGQWLPKPTGN